MSVKHVEDDDEFDAEVTRAGAKLIVMDFFATWCGPCRTIAPHFEQLARQYPQVVFLKIDVQKCDKAAQTYRIQAMPTFVFVRNSLELEQIRGANASALDDAVKKHADNKPQEEIKVNWPNKDDKSGTSSTQHMQWYMGTVDSAVQETIKHQSVMLVFISNAEPASRGLLKSLEASPVRMLSADRNKLIAVRLEENTTAATQFAAIYPVTVVPAIYFISHAGKLLEVAGSEATDAKILLEKLTAAIPNYSSTAKATVSISTAASDQAAGSAKAAADEPVSSSNVTAASSQLTLEEKVARARQLAKDKREQREVQETRVKLEKEKELRQQSQSFQQSQRDRADAEVLKAAEERRKEKREQLEERQEILKKIQNDRIEREQRLNPDATLKKDNIPTSPQKSTAKSSSYHPPSHSRILFRLPDSTTITQQFEPTSTMQVVAAFVEEQVQSNEFSMLTSMPMRRLDGEEMRQKSLAELDLYPTATIIVTLPRPAGAASHHDSAHMKRYGKSTLYILQALFYMLCRFIVTGFDFLAGIFYREHWFAHRTRHLDNTQPGLVDGNHLERPETTRDERRPAQEANREQIDEQLRQRRPQKDKKDPKASSSGGNVRRLADLRKKTGSDGDTSSEDEATYNGNSTQQL